MKKLFLIPLAVYAGIGMGSVELTRIPRSQRAMMFANTVNVLSQLINQVTSNELDLNSAVNKIKSKNLPMIRPAFNYILEESNENGVTLPQGIIEAFND